MEKEKLIKCNLCNGDGIYSDYDEDGYLRTDTCCRCNGKCWIKVKL